HISTHGRMPYKHLLRSSDAYLISLRDPARLWVHRVDRSNRAGVISTLTSRGRGPSLEPLHRDPEPVAISRTGSSGSRGGGWKNANTSPSSGSRWSPCRTIADTPSNDLRMSVASYAR